MSEPFLGEVRLFTCSYPPATWAWCHGQTLPIEQNVVLFAIISNTYGGNGQTSMGLPNLQGRIPIHQGSGIGLSDYQLAQYGGQDCVKLNHLHLPKHNHQLTAVNKAGEAPKPDPDNSFLSKDTSKGGSLYFLTNPQEGTDAKMAEETLTYAGGGLAHENRQPFLAIHFCIALEGIFPQRS
ncbi:phage tail protein [Vibrio parahaemolyticus]|nr:phage tail protein [Vibrio parahaemolyticus]EIU6800285.1 phage tail protein [Vibrio parahaemolyticus]